VWVAEDGRAVRREVQTGVENAQRVQIVQGLTGQERVIVRGHEGLYEGARVAEAARTAPLAAPAPHGGHR